MNDTKQKIIEQQDNMYQTFKNSHFIEFVRREPAQSQTLEGLIYCFGWPIPDPKTDLSVVAKVIQIALAVSSDVTQVAISQLVDGKTVDNPRIYKSDKRFARDKKEHEAAYYRFDSLVRATWPDLYKDVKPFSMDARL